MGASQGDVFIAAAALALLLCVSAAAASPFATFLSGVDTPDPSSAGRALVADTADGLTDSAVDMPTHVSRIPVATMGASVTPTAEQESGAAVVFHIHTRLNPVNPQVVATNTTSSPVDPSVDTVVILHGFTGSVSSKSVTLIRDALLFKHNITVIAVQWEHLARGPWYDKAAGNTMVVAQQLFLFLLNLEGKGVDFKRVHIIGFSLGAQAAGIVGAMLEGRIGRITGLDPARPGFDTRDISGRLDSSDAQFVVGVHTGAGFVAMFEPVGHVDFYPNGGSKQPYCQTEDIPLVCNHFMAYTYFAESIYNAEAFLARRCSTWADFENGLCAANNVVSMGYHTPETSRGVYFLRTSAQEPYGLGPAGLRVDLDTNQLGATTTTPPQDIAEQGFSPNVSFPSGDHNKDSVNYGVISLGDPEVQSRGDLNSTTYLPSCSCKLSLNLSVFLTLFSGSYVLFWNIRNF